ncbi:3-dehydroquinate dehydratase-2 [Sagittula marina]|uniref:3-dehydroquinate dehydratase n=1 Tax=Sagittula marina TaxID=943940 RepID=A0A7W6DMI5_9RHOB|nr:type II 3-dehydroquinate dehydratase [Sagittula marina]MBB3985314.1 3-dehydroquinate dehydratase-2 [Sagittula marina]
MTSILVLNGPNLNLLGTRQPDVYGHDTLDDVEQMCRDHGKAHGVTVDCLQSNYEGELVTWIHEARGTYDGIILNAGAYTHTSVALADAVKGTEAKMVELHISNVHAREAFRRHSYLSAVAIGVMAGFGVRGYTLAIDALLGHLEDAA